MLRYQTLLFLACCMMFFYAQAQNPERFTYRIYDQFDTGEMYAWEPYPYQQDTGYDPNFSTRSEPAYGGKGESIFRTTKPNDANDLSQGFTKRIDLYTLASTRVKFAYYFVSDRKPEKLDVSLGTFGGDLYTCTIRSPEANTWVEVDLPIDQFTLKGKPLAANEHIQVVVMQAFYPVVSHLLTYTMLMDEFSINGERPRQFIAQSPGSTWLEHFDQSVLHRHYAPGETLALTVAPEGEIDLKEVSADLIGPNGAVVAGKIRFYDDGTHGDLKASDGLWSNNSVYKIKPGDLPGQWKIRLSGTGSTAFSRDLAFIVPVSPVNAKNHPRVFINLPELQARMAGPEPGPAKKLLENLIGRYKPSALDISKLPVPNPVAPESVTGGPYASASMGGWYNTQNALAGVINNEAWHFILTGNKEAAGRAKAALLKLCSLPSWNHPWMEANGNHTYYPGAPAAIAAGIGYDLLYQVLSEEERTLVRRGIMENSVKPFYRDMVELNRMPTSNSNHIGVILSGVGIAAIAIAGDDPALPGLEPYFSGILAKTRQFIDRTMLPEGSYNEPYTYQEMGYRELVEVLYSLEKNYGIDYTSTTNLKEFYYYPMYVTLNDRGRYQDLGDVSPTYSFTQQPSQWLVYKMKDPFMYKYVKPAWDSGSARGGILPYLWYTEGIQPKSREDLPASRLFEGKGHMVMRSGWDDSGSILIYKAGPNGNHYHYDQGTILLTHNGEELLSDAGHSSSYYANLYYPGYYTQAIGHNVMLVDMNAESQAPGDFNNGIASLKNYPVITHSFASGIADAVDSRLESVYKGELSGYTRTLLSMKNGPFFLFDQVKSQKQHSYNWIFHAEHTNGKSSIEYSGKRFTITRPAARLTVDVLLPETIDGKIRDSDRAESFIALSSGKLNDAVFLAVMRPEGKTRDGGFSSMPGSSLIESGGWTGAKVQQDGTDYFAFFRPAADQASGIEGFTTDASRFMAAIEGGKLSKTYFEGSNFEGYGERIEFSVPLTAAAEFKDTGIRLEVDGGSAYRLSLDSARPSGLRVNGLPVKNWKYDQGKGRISVQLPAGRSEIWISKP